MTHAIANTIEQCDNSLLRSLITSIPDIIFYKDCEGRYLGANPAFEAYAGIGEKDIIGRTDLDFLPHDAAESYRLKDMCIGVRGRVTGHVEEMDGVVRLAFLSDGISLMPEAIDTFFEVCGQRKRLVAGGDLGLRPALSRRILRIFGGDAVVRNLEPRGVEIAMTLPLAEGQAVNVP